MTSPQDWINTREALKTRDYPLDNVRLLHDIVLVRPDTVEEVTKGGIILATEVDEEQHKGRVVKGGPKLADIEEGDEVFFNKYEGLVMKLGGERLLVMREDDIKAKVA